jgi:hypothetical protein
MTQADHEEEADLIFAVGIPFGLARDAIISATSAAAGLFSSPAFTQQPRQTAASRGPLKGALRQPGTQRRSFAVQDKGTPPLA